MAFSHSCVFNNNLTAFENTLNLILLKAYCWPQSQSRLHTQTCAQPPLWYCWHKHTHMHSLWVFFLPQAPSYSKKEKPFVNNVCLYTQRGLCEFQRDCVHFCKLNSRDGAGGSRLRPQSTLLLGNNSNKPELKWCFLYLLWRIMMPLLARSHCVTIYFHLLFACQLLPRFALHQLESTWNTYDNYDLHNC